MYMVYEDLIMDKTFDNKTTAGFIYITTYY